jgi:hypothetical protein
MSRRIRSANLTTATEAWEPVDPNEWNGYDLDCADAGGPVEIYGSDPNGLDRDGDGIGCE